MNQKLKIALAVIGSVLLILLAGVIGFIIGRGNAPSITPPDEQEQPDENPDEAEWTEYKNTNPSYTISYPEGWVVDSSAAEYLGSDDQEASLEMHRGAYYITYYINRGAFGPSICTYEGEEVSEGIPAIEFGKYTEITTTGGVIYRRAENPEVTDPEKIEWRFCAKGPDGVFATLNGPSYLTPANYDEEIVAEMDAIIKSMR